MGLKQEMFFALPPFPSSGEGVGGWGDYNAASFFRLALYSAR